MNNRFIRKLLFVTTFVCLQQIEAQNVYTLRQCIDTAIKNNLQVSQAGFQASNAAIDLQQAKAQALPGVSANIGHGENLGRNIDPFTNSYINQRLLYAGYSLNAGITLWNGNSIRNGKQSASLLTEASRMDWEQAKNTVTINVILAYLQVLSAEEQLVASVKRRDLTKEQVDRLEVLYQNGATQPGIYYDLKAQLSSDEMTVINSKAAIENARILLAQWMNTNYDPTLQLEKQQQEILPAPYESDRDIVYNTAEANLALIKAANLREQSAEKTIKAWRGALMPSISLNGSLGTNISSAASTLTFVSSSDVPSGDYVLIDGIKNDVITTDAVFTEDKINYFNQFKNNFNTQIGINIQIPILNGLQVRSQLKRAQITQQRIQTENCAAKTQLKQTIDQAYINRHAAMERYIQMTEQVNALTESYRIATVRFEAGAINSVEYLTTKNNMENAIVNRISGRYDYMLRGYVLDFYMGKTGY